MLIGIAVVVGLLSQRGNQTSSTSDPAQTSFDPTQLYTVSNEQFVFESRWDWQFDPEASNPPDRYVFAHSVEELRVRELTITVDAPERLLATRVLPVSVEGTSLAAGELSDKCAIDPSLPVLPTDILISNARFTCVPDLNSFNVVVAQIGGTDVLQLTRSDGSAVQVQMLAKELSATPDARYLPELVASFAAR